MYPQVIQKLIKLFSKFPSVGPRTASRFVFYLTKLSQSELDSLAENIKDLKKNIKFCSLCFNTYDTIENNYCEICQNQTRARDLLCIIEKETDLEKIEKTKMYNGLYFILGGLLYPKRENSIERINNLKNRIEKENFQEIIIAINPTPEGEATRLYLERELSSFNTKITHLGRGLPMGGELEYADNETLESAFESRK